MPDITMCGGKGCNKKDKCYRYTAKPSAYQSYFMGVPFTSKSCEYFMPVKTVTDSEKDLQTDMLKK
jgi:hypothetical protein